MPDEILKFASPGSHVSDKGHIAWVCYFLLGAGFLAPWNALITATDYFSAVYPNPHMDRLFTVCYLPTCLLFLGLTLRYSEVLSRHIRIVASFIGFTIIMVMIPVLDALMVAGRQQAPPAAMAVVLSTVVVIGMLDGICQGAIFGDAATLPPRYTHAVVGGTASSGLLISLLRIVTKASLPQSHQGMRLSTAIYFALAAVISLLCLAVQTVVLPRLAYVRFHRTAKHHGSSSSASSLELPASPSRPSLNITPQQQHMPDETLQGAACNQPQPAHGGEGDLERPQEQTTAPSSPSLPLLMADSSLSAATPSGEALRGQSPSQRRLYAPTPASELDQQQERLLGQEVCSSPRKHGHPVEVRAVWRRIRDVPLALLLLYTVTLSIFPGFLAEDVHSAALGDWYPILLIAAFNAADLVGKLWPFDASRWAQRQVLILSGCRLLFVPAFVAGAMLGLGPVIMASLTFMLGLSNGFLTAVSMALAGLLVSPREAEVSETIAVFAMVAGLNVGAYAGWLWLLSPAH